MKNFKETSKMRGIKKVHIGILAAVFLTLIAAVSVVAFNAFATGVDVLPEGYTNVNISGIYYRGVLSSVDKDVSQIRILDYGYHEVDNTDDAEYIQYPSLDYKIQKIEAYDSDNNLLGATEASFSFDLSELGKVSIFDGADILSYLYSKDASICLIKQDDRTSYHTESEFKAAVMPATVTFVLTLTDGEQITVSSLNSKTVYPALLSYYSLDDSAAYSAISYEVIETYDLKKSTEIVDTSFLTGNLTIPLKAVENGDGSTSYRLPDYQLVYSDGDVSEVIENITDETVTVYNSTLFCFGGVRSGAAVCTPNNAINFKLALQYGAYGYRTFLPARIELNYKLGDDVTDTNDPLLEEDSRTDPISTEKYLFNGAYGFITNDGSNVSKEGNFLDRWVLVDNDGNPIMGDDGNYISEARPGEKLYFNYLAGKSSTGDTYYELLEGYTYEGIDPDTGELRYSYTASPIWRDSANLKYDLNLAEVVQCWNQSGTTFRNDGDGFLYQPPTFYDGNNYALTESATIIGDTYTSSSGSYTFLGWYEDEALSLLKKTADGNYIDAYDQVYHASSILQGGDQVLMDRDHTLYAVWCIAEGSEDDYVKVTATVINGKFIHADDPENPINSSCSANNFGNCNRYSSSWVNSTGTSSAFVSKQTNYLDFLSIPDNGYSSYKLKYKTGSKTYSKGYGENELPLSNAYADGRCDHFSSPLESASSDETYYYEIEYVDSSACQIYFYDNNPTLGNTPDQYYFEGTVGYTAYGLWFYKEYALSEWSVPQEDGSVKLNGVGTISTEWDSSTYTTTSKWNPVPDAEFAFDGYYFAGWSISSFAGYGSSGNAYYKYDENDLIDTIEFTKDPMLSSVYLVAVWKEIPNVIYYSDTDKATAIDTQSKSPNLEIIVGLSTGVAEPTKEHYTFAGWECVTTGVTVTDGKFTMPQSDVEFVPKWEINKNDVIYKVTNAPTGYTEPATQSVEYGKDVTVAAVPNVTGYDFEGWECVTVGVTVTDGKFTMPDKAVTFTGTFTPKSFTLNYYNNIDNSSPIATQSKEYNAKVSVADGVTAPTREGYTLDGWNTSANGGGTSYTNGAEFTMPANDVNLYAMWTKNTYQLVYDKNTTDTVENMPENVSDLTYDDVRNGYTLDTVTVPTRKGYTFTGWKVGSVENASKAQYADFNNSECKAVAAAQWQENTYTVVYNKNSPTGSDADVSDMPQNASVTYTRLLTGYSLSGSPKCNEYAFKGWSKTSTGTVIDKVYATDLPGSGTVINVYAVWYDNEYRVTYDANGATKGTAPKDDNSYKKGADVTVLDKGNLSYVEYNFKEWNTDPKGKGTAYKAGDVFEMPASDVTLYAIWVDSNGNVVIPGTGENLIGIYVAFAALIISVVTGCAVTVYVIKRRKTA